MFGSILSDYTYIAIVVTALKYVCITKRPPSARGMIFLCEIFEYLRPVIRKAAAKKFVCKTVNMM